MKTRFRFILALFGLTAACAQYTAEPAPLAFLLNQGGAGLAPSSGSPGIVLTESSSSTSVFEGSGYDFYSIELASAPSANVTVSLAFDGSQIKLNDSTTSPLALTFTPSNYNTAQTVIVRAVDDSLVEGNHTSTISHTAASSDDSYNGLAGSDLSVSIVDDDAPGISISQSGGATILTEGGASDSYTVVLTTAPTATVTVALAFDTTQLNVNGSTTSPVNLTFTTANWYTPQTVTLLAQDDSLVEGPHSSSITHTATSADSGYNGLSGVPVTANITDANGPGVSITESSGASSVTEGGATDSYDIVLTSAPSSDVTVSLSFDSSQIVVAGSSSSPVSLTFTSGNWNTPQTVSLSAVDDTTIEGTHSASISHSVSSSDSSYNGMSVPDVTVNIVDDDITPLVAGGVQTNLVTTSALATNDSISSVDLSKAFVMCYFTSSSSKIGNQPTCQLSASNQVRIEKGISSSTVYVRYYVMEFANGAQVQRGSFSMANGDSSYALSLASSVDLSKSFIIYYARTTATGYNLEEQKLLKAVFTSSTGVQFTRGETGIPLDVEWQVVELSGAQVQSGTATLADGSGNVTVPTAVYDPSSSFLIFNYSAGDVNGIEGDYLMRGNLASSSSLSFSRQGSNKDLNLSWFLVEMINGPNLQRGTINLSGSQSSNTATLSPAVNPSFTMPIISFTVNSSNSSSVDSGYFRPNIPASNQIFVERYNTESKTARVDWYTIELTSQ